MSSNRTKGKSTEWAQLSMTPRHIFQGHTYSRHTQIPRSTYPLSCTQCNLQQRAGSRNPQHSNTTNNYIELHHLRHNLHSSTKSQHRHFTTEFFTWPFLTNQFIVCFTFKSTHPPLRASSNLDSTSDKNYSQKYFPHPRRYWTIDFDTNRYISRQLPLLFDSSHTTNSQPQHRQLHNRIFHKAILHKAVYRHVSCPSLHICIQKITLNLNPRLKRIFHRKQFHPPSTHLFIRESLTSNTLLQEDHSAFQQPSLPINK